VLMKWLVTTVTDNHRVYLARCMPVLRTDFNWIRRGRSGVYELDVFSAVKLSKRFINSSQTLTLYSRCCGRAGFKSLKPFIHFISQNTGYIKTMKNKRVLKVFHGTERPVALTTAHTDTNTKHKAKKTQSKWVMQIMSILLIINWLTN